MHTLSVNANLEYEMKVKNSRILVCDDIIANVSLIENILHRLGYKQVLSVTDPRKLFTVAKDWQPDLVVLDLAMPHMDGFAIMDHFRSQVPKEEWIPILVLTANAEGSTKRKALAAGATEFIAKPCDSSELVWRIRNMLLMRAYNLALRDQNQILEQRVADRTKSLLERTAELERALVDLQQAQKQVVRHERFRAFAEMAGGVAHDFNNVLQCVIGYTDLMLQNPAVLDERNTLVDFLQTMNTAGVDASRIVARLRDFYRPREETEVFSIINLNALLKEVIPLTQPKWHAQALAEGRVIEIKCDLQEIPDVPCNAPEIRELLMNLIFNAVDAMPGGGTISLCTQLRGDAVTIGVMDTGIGMTDEVKLRCMEPYFSTKGEKGTGLGLSMVFGIVQRHEGTVDIESAVGQGTTFWITLPLQARDLGVEEEEPVPLERTLRILFVDDDPLPRDIVARFLRQDGHDVAETGSGRDALARFQDGRFDLVITDHAMPHITGLQLASAIRRTEPSQPVILLTGLGDGNLPEHEASQVSMVLRKPVAQKSLRRALAMAMAPILPSSATESVPEVARLA